MVQKIVAPSPALQANSRFHSSKSAAGGREGERYRFHGTPKSETRFAQEVPGEGEQCWQGWKRKW